MTGCESATIPLTLGAPEVGIFSPRDFGFFECQLHFTGEPVPDSQAQSAQIYDCSRETRREVYNYEASVGEEIDLMSKIEFRRSRNAKRQP